jgi:formate dehydrogenase maturation protein FdhE
VKRLLSKDDERAAPATPVACPFCGSAKVAAATEKVDSFTYWRCETCGQMWNVGRLRVASRHGYGGR